MARTKSGLLTRIAAPFCKFTLALGAALGIVSVANAADYVMKAGTTTANWGDEGLWVGEGGNYVITWEAPNADITFTAAESIASGFWIENADGLVKFEASDPTYGLTMTTGDMHVGGVNHGYLEIDSGTHVFQNDLYIAYSKAHWYDGDNGSFTVKGGSVTVGNSIVVANYGGVDGTVGELYISGGTLATKTIVAGAGAGKVEFSGGTLKATAAGTLIGSGLTVNVPAEYSSTIDTAGFDVTVASAVGGTGTLNIVGGGKVTFTAVPTCSITVANDGSTYELPAYSEGAYYWIGGASGKWADGANWSLSPAGEAANAYPSSYESDIAVIGTDARITLPAANANTKDLYINGCVSFVGGKIHAKNITGVGKLTMLDGTVFYASDVTEVSVDVEIPNAANVYVSTIGDYHGVRFTSSCALTGTGTVTFDGNRPSHELAWDASGFSGKIVVVRDANTRNNTKLLAETATNDGMTWEAIFSGGEFCVLQAGTYKFGSLSGEIYLPKTSAYNFVKNVIFG